MEKFSNYLLIIWCLLAVLAFIGSFSIPVLLWKIVGLVFGGLNIIIILSWVLPIVVAIREKIKLDKSK